MIVGARRRVPSTASTASKVCGGFKGAQDALSIHSMWELLGAQAIQTLHRITQYNCEEQALIWERTFACESCNSRDTDTSPVEKQTADYQWS